MSNYNSIEKVISAEIMRTNEDNLLANRICNTSFVGDIKNRGDSVTFVGLNDPAVYDYEGTVNYEDIQDSATVLRIDQGMPRLKSFSACSIPCIILVRSFSFLSFASASLSLNTSPTPEK